MTEANRKVSGASARAHTRKSMQSNSFHLPSGMSKKVSVLLLIGILSWMYQAIQPPPPKICGSPNGPPVTAPRIRLRGGRHLAYKENGVPKDKAKYKVIFVHGFDSCRYDTIPLPQRVAEELGIYLLSFDRAGYGESDPNPKRTVKDTALDIEELADQLGIGSKFYVIGFSMGGQAIWSCLKYIPHRLAGATLIAPVVNYWWRGLPTNLTQEAYKLQLPRDRWAVGVSHYAPWLTYWWNTQKWFPASSVIAHSPDILCSQDKEVFQKFEARESYVAQIRQQGDFESLHRDMIVGFGSWEFDPMDLENLFPNGEGSVHLWHGDEDGLVPASLQRYIAAKLPWIHYHELKGSGHIFPYIDGMPETIVKALLFGEK